MKFAAVTCALGVLLGSAPAIAAAPQPTKPVAIGMYFGRWYQIAQIAQTNRHRCPGATDDFSGGPNGGFSVLVTCHDPSGGAREIRAGVSIVQGSGAAKFKMSFFGGLISREYWVLDHALDQSWVLMATPGGNNLWLLARRPVLDPAVRATATARIAALGYNVGRLTSVS